MLVVWGPGGRHLVTDGPVLLDFDGEQVEIVHNKFDDLFDHLERRRSGPGRWTGPGGHSAAVRQDAFPEDGPRLAGQRMRSCGASRVRSRTTGKGHGRALGFVFPQRAG
ncbi:hypothetical protein GCM10017559_82930 [Streptosporangium longisporum]|uniref:Uncharacterized protein n=1 Tax=Streptosporangium longisporum TaxID=46187 RepID=A0ABP6LIW8_9ACTN